MAELKYGVEPAMVRYLKIKNSVLSDRFTRGFLAGILAGIPVMPYNQLSNYLFGTLSYTDFAGIMIYGYKPRDIMEFLLALGAQFIFFAFLGGVFALLIPNLTSKNLLFKGWMFSCMVWFSSYVITILFKVPELEKIPFKTAFSNLIGATLWGLLLAFMVIWLDKRVHPAPQRR